MKNRIIFFASTFILLQFFSCKDKSIMEPRKPVENILCNGTELVSYFPITDYFTGKFKIINSIPQQTEKLEYAGDTTINLMDYKIISEKLYIDTILIGTTQFKFYRTDTEGNVLRYFLEYNEEYMYTPVQPILNEVVAEYAVIDGSHIRKVIDTNASFATSACEYVGLLKIEEVVDMEDDEPIVNIYYYKKGLGIIAKVETIGLNIVTTTLTEINFE